MGGWSYLGQQLLGQPSGQRSYTSPIKHPGLLLMLHRAVHSQTFLFSFVKPVMLNRHGLSMSIPFMVQFPFEVPWWANIFFYRKCPLRLIIQRFERRNATILLHRCDLYTLCSQGASSSLSSSSEDLLRGSRCSDVPPSQRHLSTSVTLSYMPGQRKVTHQRMSCPSQAPPWRWGVCPWEWALFLQSEQKRDCTTGFCSLSCNWLSCTLFTVIHRQGVRLMLWKPKCFPDVHHNLWKCQWTQHLVKFS